MTAVTYIARRSLISGHTAGTPYSLDLRCTDVDAEREVRRRRKEPLAMVGAEVIRLGGRTSYSVTLAPLRGGANSPLAAVIEFLDSCEDQSFTFDPYGTVLVPGTAPPPFTAHLLSEGYQLERVTRLKAGGHNDHFRLSFRVAPA